MAWVPSVRTAIVFAVSLSLPLYIHGVLVILRSERVTWGVLMRHLRSIIPGVVLTLVPVVSWMLPRFFSGQYSSLLTVHAFFALQAYAFLAIGLWGIIPIFRAKRARGLYREPNPDLELTEIDDRMPHWRRRLRIGVFGYLGFWLIAYATGLAMYLQYW